MENSSKCADQNIETDWFFPDEEQLPDRKELLQRIDEIRDFCGDCATRAACLDAGRSTIYGYWGGMSNRDRVKFRRSGLDAETFLDNYVPRGVGRQKATR